MFILMFRNILLVFICITIIGQATAQDKADVELICPDNVFINCEADLKKIVEYGQATYRIGLEITEMEDQQAKKNIDDCGKGNINAHNLFT